MENLDALELSRKLREETSQILNDLTLQEKLKLFEKTKARYAEKIKHNNIMQKTSK